MTLRALALTAIAAFLWALATEIVCIRRAGPEGSWLWRMMRRITE